MVGRGSVLIGSINRQLNAAINLHMRLRFGYTEKWEGGRKRVQLRMEGAPPAAGVVGPRGATLPPYGWVRPDTRRPSGVTPMNP